MSTKPDTGTREHPGKDSGEPTRTEGHDEADVEVAVDTGGENELVEDDGDIAIEVEAPAEPEREPDAAAALQARIAELEKAHAELEERQKETYDRLLRTTADLDNFRKRTRRDIDNARLEASSRTLVEMLPVVDNLERAVTHAETTDDAKGIADGVSLVLRQFSQALERCNVSPVEAVGKPFDPNLHEAVAQQESADHPPGTVVAELQKGYVIGDRLLRPTLAVVSTAPAAAEKDERAEPKPNGHDTSAGAVTAPESPEAGALEDAGEQTDESED